MELDKLDTKKKTAIAKVMLDLNYSASEIAKELKVNRSTVYRYGQKEIAEDLQQFATEIKTIFTIKNLQLIAKVVSMIEKKLAFGSLRDLTNTYTVLKSHTQSLYEIYKDSEHEKKWGRLSI